MGDIASNWKVLSGEKNWDGLLDPLDDKLRRYLIHYGFLTEAVPAALNDIEQSPGYHLSRYPPETYFNDVGIEQGNPFKYQLTDFFYGRSEFDILGYMVEGESSYFGFVAVATDEGKTRLGRRDIVVCWRGTTDSIEWQKDFDALFVSGSGLFPNTDAQLHQGFHSIYTSSNSVSPYTKKSARDQILAAVRRQVDKYAKLKEEISITITGHSLGAALATLTAVDIAYNGYNKPTGSDTVYPVTAFVYASPRVGDCNFRDQVFNKLLEKSNLHILRLRNNRDVVPDLPPKYLDYVDVGVELYLDTTESPYLKTESISEAHDLNLYMHGVAGYHGNGEDFKLVVDLDVSLLNKYNDLLKNEYKVPPNWWSNVFRKGMVQKSDGTWVLEDYVPDPPAE